MDLATAVRAAQGGDEEAFRVLYRTVQPQLLNYVRSFVGGADAEDVASEAWLQIARDLPGFRDTGGGKDGKAAKDTADAIRGWTARIARNRALDHLRAVGRRPIAAVGVEELLDRPGGQDTAEEAVTAVGTGRALAAIASLPRDQAEAVLLRVVMGLDSKTAAEVLGKRPGAMRMATSRGLRRLAELLEYDGGASSVTFSVSRTLEDMR